MNEVMEAWALALDHPQWAERVREEFEFLTPSSDRDRLLHQLGGGPNLRGLWQQLRDDLRPISMDPTRVARLLQLGLDYLSPPAEFAAHWKNVQHHAPKYRSRAAHVAVNPALLRSPQPRLEALQHLRQNFSLSGLVNLRQESEESQALCRQVGLDYHWIPVEDMSVPTLDQVEQFLRLVERGVHLVHCWAGQGRTGLFVACYRIFHGWDVEEAIARTDQEIFSRGMRPGQRDWLRQFRAASPGRPADTRPPVGPKARSTAAAAHPPGGPPVEPPPAQ